MSDDGFDVDAFLDGYRPRVEPVELVQRGDLVSEHARLEGELAEAAGSGSSDDDGHVERSQELAERIVALEAEIEASKATFTFSSCSHEAWYRLMAEHPPSNEERAAQPQAAVGTEFQIHALAECSRSPKLTVAQARRMRDMRPDDFDRCWLAVVQANEGQVVVPKSAMATAVRGLLERSSTNRKARRSRGRSSPAANGKASRSTSTTKTAG